MIEPFAISFLAISLDYGSFKYASSQGIVREANPLVFNQEVVKVSQAIAIGYGLKELKKKNGKLYWFTVGGLFLANGALAVHNLRQVK